VLIHVLCLRSGAVLHHHLQLPQTSTSTNKRLRQAHPMEAVPTQPTQTM
jgi:hypothetical protein